MEPGFLFGDEGAPPMSKKCATQDTRYPLITYCLFHLFLLSEFYPKINPPAYVGFLYSVKKLPTRMAGNYSLKRLALMRLAGRVTPDCRSIKPDDIHGTSQRTAGRHALWSDLNYGPYYGGGRWPPSHQKRPSGIALINRGLDFEMVFVDFGMQRRPGHPQ